MAAVKSMSAVNSAPCFPGEVTLTGVSRLSENVPVKKENKKRPAPSELPAAGPSDSGTRADRSAWGPYERSSLTRKGLYISGADSEAVIRLKPHHRLLYIPTAAPLSACTSPWPDYSRIRHFGALLHKHSK
ncbi:hypothetical protein SKAU_G00202170 [Synaphobranchus kaupii]|uniref:Uncharacterized protein n=1 Tax=Synaphobranchus kaupii TaxID=118154 RepID=A0A9Q1FFQ4_SYNKA|nr:hypothetical protein SKAU_G00202170 [Synaphobranchus kaupii]